MSGGRTWLGATGGRQGQPRSLPREPPSSDFLQKHPEAEGSGFLSERSTVWPGHKVCVYPHYNLWNNYCHPILKLRKIRSFLKSDSKKLEYQTLDSNLTPESTLIRQHSLPGDSRQHLGQWTTQSSFCLIIPGVICNS